MRANHNAHDKFIKKTHLAKNEALAAAAMREATAEKQKGQQRAKPSWEVDDCWLAGCCIASDRANLTGLVLGCIEAKFCK